ncbi:MAG: hypothetical protein ACLQF1_13010 [Methyloceanibacter sp.]|jgi:hypothetical protein
MNLMHSICCFFRGRCASDATEPPKADKDRRDAVETRDTGVAAQRPPRPVTPETEASASGSANEIVH